MTTADTFKPHTLTVTRTVYPPDLPGEEEFVETEYDLDCPGVTDHCRRWEPCTHAACTVNAEYQHHSRDALGHGRHHLHIDGVWMVPTGQCLYASHDRLPDAAEYLDLPAGDHEVDVDYMGDGDIVLVHLGTCEATR